MIDTIDLTPDAIIRSQRRAESTHPGRAASARSPIARPPLVLPSEIHDVLLRLTAARILDVHDVGRGDIYLVSTVVDGDAEVPVATEMRSYPGIADGQDLPIESPEITLYHSSGRSPEFLEWRLLIAESDSGIRDTGELLVTLSKDADWRGLAAALKVLVASGSPPVGAVVGIVDALLGVIGRILKMNKDDRISLLAATYTRAFDDLGQGEHTARVGDAWLTWQIRIA